MTTYYICPFHALFPEQAWKEYHSMELFRHEVIPTDGYALIESYCIDPDCDCRRVMLNIISRDGRRHVATISFGLDREEEMAGPYLDPLNPQSEYAEALLELIEEAILSDPDYVARLERHYHQVKDAVTNPTPEVRQVMSRFSIDDADDLFLDEEEEAEGEEDEYSMGEWNQWLADSRSFETMRRIALDAMEFRDDDAAYYEYAREHKLTVNEVVYYLNAYEYGGEAGLRALGVPDIIPPEVARRAIRTIKKTLDETFPDLPYRVTDEGTAIGIYQIQERWHTDDQYLFPVCQLRLTLATHQWHLYWMRKFDAWWPYPTPEKGRRYTLNARLQQVLEDEHGCFWG